MQLTILTSNSNNYHYIDRLDDLYRIAMSIKCNIFIMDPYTNTLYGAASEPYSIVETQIPFKVCDIPFSFTDSVFMSTKSKEVMKTYKSFFYVAEYPQFLFPEYMRAKIMNGKVGIDWDRFVAIDLDINEVIDDCICTQFTDDIFPINILRDFIAAYKDGCYRGLYLDEIIFEKAHENPIIVQVSTSSVSEGAKIMCLEHGEDRFVFYMFKSLISPLTRADKLTITICKDKFIPRKFIITLIFDKKSKLGIPEMPTQRIKTHAAMINLL